MASNEEVARKTLAAYEKIGDQRGAAEMRGMLAITAVRGMEELSATQPQPPEIVLYDTQSDGIHIVRTPAPLTLEAMTRLGLGLVNTSVLYEHPDQN